LRRCTERKGTFTSSALTGSEASGGIGQMGGNLGGVWDHFPDSVPAFQRDVKNLAEGQNENDKMYHEEGHKVQRSGQEELVPR